MQFQRPVLVASLVILSAGVAISVLDKNFQWLGRFGALVICSGVIALARPSIVGKSLLPEVVMDEEGGISNDPNYYVRIGDPVPDSVVQDRRSQIAVGILGPWLCLIGTTTNGFAELINKVLGWHA